MSEIIIEGLAVGRCEFCGYLCEWDEIPTAGDPTSDGTVQCCPECNEGESFDRYYLTEGQRTMLTFDTEVIEMVKEAVEMEREAIADAVSQCDARATPKGIAAAIRARGQG